MTATGRRFAGPVFPLAVYAIVALNVFVYVREVVAGDPDRLINAFAAIPFDITRDVVLGPPSPPYPALTLVTAMFFHASLLHIGLNMLVLVLFGPQIEVLCGPLRFVAFYLLAGVAGNLAQLSIDPSSHIPAIGASGAIAGVLGAYLMNVPRNRAALPAVLIIAAWAVLQFAHGFGSLSSHVSSAQGAGTAYFAHIGGLLSGILTIGLFKRRRSAGRRHRY